MSLRVPIDQLGELSTRHGDQLTIVGSGTARGLDLSRLHFASITIESGRGLFADTVFEDCDFSEMQTTALDLADSVFERCRFTDVRVQMRPTVTHARFVDCVFSGEWQANFTAGGRWRPRVRGNDFTQATGMAFYHGVDPHANRFDLGGRHLILRRDRECWQAACALVDQGHPWLGMKLSSLRGEGPIGYAQDWTLLYRDTFTAVEWEQLCADRHDPGPPPVGRRLRHTLYRVSPARRRALAANLTDDPDPIDD
jgi:hypothetical protein